MLVQLEVGVEEVVEISWSPGAFEIVVVDGEGPCLLPHHKVVVPEGGHRYVKVGLWRVEVRTGFLRRGQQVQPALRCNAPRVAHPRHEVERVDQFSHKDFSGSGRPRVRDVQD
eukprot:8654651-Lingulodinium_polyedra.AAC.1